MVHRGAVYLLSLVLSVCLGIKPVAALELDHEALKQSIMDNPDDSNSRVLLARYYLRNGDITAAQDMLANVKDDHSVAQRLLAQIQASFDQQALLTKLGVTSVFDRDALDLALPALESEDSEQALEFYDFLTEYGFSYSDALRVRFGQNLLAQKRFDEVLKLANTADDKKHPKLLAQKGRACENLGKSSCALSAYQQSWKQSPSYASGQTLARYYLTQGDLGSADRVISQLENQWPDSEDNRQLRHELNTQLDNQQGDLSQAFQINPGDSALRALVTALYDNGQQTAALETLDQSLASYAPSDRTRMFAAERYAWSGRFKSALAQLDQLMAATPSSELLRGRILAWSGDFTQANDVLYRLIAQKPAKGVVEQARMMLGFSAHWSGDSKSAAGWFLPLMDSETPGLDKPAMEEVIKISQGDFTGPIARLKKQLVDQPENPRPLLDLAGIYERQGDRKGAIEAFEDYLQRTPDDGFTRRRLAHIYFSDDQLTNGLIHLERYAYKVFTPDALTELAQNYYWSGEEAVASRVITQRNHAFPESVKGWDFKSTNNGRAAGPSRTRVQQASSSKTLNTQTFNKNTVNNNDEALMAKAQAFFDKESYAEAANLLDAHLQTMPGDIKAHRLYAFTLSRQSRFTEAASEFYLVSRSNYASDDIFFHYGYNLARSGNYIEARRVLSRLEKRLVAALGDEAEEHTEKAPTSDMSDQMNAFLIEWVDAWQSRDFDAYSDFYVADIRDDAAWQKQKQGSFARNTQIKVVFDNPKVLSEQNAPEGIKTVLQFEQDYQASTMTDKGMKTLTVICGDGSAMSCLIEKESWRALNLNQSGQDAARIAFQKSLLTQTRQELAKITVQAQAPSMQDTVLKGVVFSEGVKRKSLPTEEVLALEVGRALPVSHAAGSTWLLRDTKTPYVAYSDVEGAQNNAPRLGFEARHASDSGGMRYREYGVNTYLPLQEGGLNLTAAPYHFNSDECEAAKGTRVKGEWAHDNYAVGTHLDTLDGRLAVSPYGQLTQTQGDTTRVWRLGLASLFFDKLSCETYAQAHKRLQVGYSQYTPYALANLWYGLSAGVIDDGNKDLVAEFDASRPWVEGDKFRYQTALSGWYMLNATSTDDYYSPSVYDSTSIRTAGEYSLMDSMVIVANANAGYAVTDARTLYGYGLSARYEPNQGMRAELGCRRNNSGGVASGSGKYTATECTLSAGYRW